MTEQPKPTRAAIADPCPFCASTKIEQDFGDESAKYRCRNCGAQSGRVYFTAEERESDDFSVSEAEALAAWNRRAVLAQTPVAWAIPQTGQFSFSQQDERYWTRLVDGSRFVVATPQAPQDKEQP